MAVANPEEEIDQTKAPLLEHLIELRRRLIYSVAAICIWLRLLLHLLQPHL